MNRLNQPPVERGVTVIPFMTISETRFDTVRSVTTPPVDALA